MAFFKLPGHYVFDYKPIYYDPKKEEKLKRIKKIKEELNIELSDEEKNIRDISFRTRRIERQKRQRTSTIRFLFFLIFFILTFYILLFTDYINILTDHLTK